MSVLTGVDAVIPDHGQLFDRLNGGVSAGIGLGIPLGPVRESPAGGIINWSGSVGYRYLWLDGKNDVQLNQPGGKDFNVNHANFHLCEFGVERRVVFPTAVFSPMRMSPNAGILARPQSTLAVSFGFRGLLGGANADVSQAKFDPAKTQVIIQGAPRDEAFAGGYEVYGKLGLQFPSGIEISVRAGYGQLFTSLLQNQSSANGYVPIGVTLTVPLELRGEQAFRGRLAPGAQGFNVPSLLGPRSQRPYFDDGRFPTLADVLRFRR